MKIRLIGQRNNLGIGIHYSNFANALRQVSHWGNMVEEVNCDDMTELLAAGARSEPTDINITFVSIPIQTHYKGANIQWVVFESDVVPDVILSTMLAADQVWVPSSWGKDILITNGIDPARCEVVPEGVDADQYHPYAAKEPCSKLTYLITGKYELRKSIVETIFAWSQEFGNDPDVELVVKTNHFINQDQKYNELTEYISGLGLTNVHLLWGSATVDQMIKLYQQSDVFVLPSKGEGWGLPLIEAAATGLPIITTLHSGQTEFLKSISSSVTPVEFDMVPIACPEYQYFYPSPEQNWGQWAQPRIDSIRRALRTTRSNHTTLKQHARDNSHIIRKEFSWHQCAYNALNLLQKRGLLTG